MRICGCSDGLVGDSSNATRRGYVQLVANLEWSDVDRHQVDAQLIEVADDLVCVGRLVEAWDSIFRTAE